MISSQPPSDLGLLMNKKRVSDQQAPDFLRYIILDPQTKSVAA